MVEVAIAIVVGVDGRVLVSERRADQLYPGQLEFPGGKLESGESPQQALRRELQEELGIALQSCLPLAIIPKSYGERSYLINAFLVHSYQGEPEPREGQRCLWLAPERLPAERFLAGNKLLLELLGRGFAKPWPSC